MTCSRNISRIALRAEAGREHPDLRHDVVGQDVRRPRGLEVGGRQRPVPSMSPATTTGPGHGTRGEELRIRDEGPRSCRHRCHPPATARPDEPSAAPRGLFGGSSPPARTATTLPPLERATRRPASAVTSSSLPTTAIRRPPPADEQASTSACNGGGDLSGEFGATCVDAVEDVALAVEIGDGGAVARGRQQHAAVAVDERGLGEGGPDVDTEQRRGWRHCSAGLRQDIEGREDQAEQHGQADHVGGGTGRRWRRPREGRRPPGGSAGSHPHRRTHRWPASPGRGRGP